MKDQDKMDKWLRNKMENFRPPVSDAGKDRFFSEVYNSPVSTKKWKFISLLLAFLLPLFIIIAFILNAFNTPKLTSSSSSSKSNSSIKSSESKNEISNSTVISAYKTTKNITKSRLSKANIFSDNHSPHTQSYGVINSLIFESNHNNNDTLKEIDFTSDTEDINPVDTFLIDSSFADTISSDSHQDSKPDFNYGNAYWNTSLSFYYCPEILYNVIGDEKLLQNIGIEFNKRLFNGNYLVGTGLGVSLTKGYYEYAIEYNEFLGNFQRLDSITFNWQPASFSMEQTLHTSEEKVFDNKISTDYTRVERKFIYLQVPLILGYDLYNNRRWSAGLRVNPVLSILLSRKPVDFRYETGENRLIQINRITPERVKTNWQLAAGITLSRRLSDNFWLEFEPRFSYYFNSVYEKPSISESPWSVSLKIALGLRY